MTRWRFVLKSLWHYRRTHGGVVLGSAIGAAVLVGALLTGDSVRGTLDDIAASRIGRVHNVMSTGDRFFRATLADSFDDAAAVLTVNAVATTPAGRSRANRVQLLGVDDRFWRFAPASIEPLALHDDQIAINERLAAQLNARPGDTIVIRAAQPSSLPRDMPLAQVDDASTALRLTVAGIVGDRQFGRFNLQADQAPPYNAFVSRNMLADRLTLAGKANLLLTDDNADGLRDYWSIEDAQLTVTRDDQFVQISSDRVFMDQPYADAFSNSTLVLTYFVNRIAGKDRVTPYSTVAAVSNLDLKPDEILITSWLADDLGAAVGDDISLTYFIPGAGRQLAEQTHRLRVAGVMAMDDPRIDPSLMPNLPGLADAEHCREWDAGFPVDYDLIRDKDEAYWTKYRGTPKALISYATGKKLWANRFGALTAIRVPPQVDVQQVIRDNVDPATVGFAFTNVRQQAADATQQSLDFGSLFLSMSFFLLVAAAVLTGLLFVFGIEQRNREIGLLAAVGWLKPAIGRYLMLEGFILAIVGSAIGCALGAWYTRAILYALNSVWQDAVASATLRFHGTRSSLAAGFIASVTIAAIAMHLTLRANLGRQARDLLTGQSRRQVEAPGPAMRTRWVAVISLFSAIGLLWMSRGASGAQAAGVFFGVGSLLLLSAIATCRVILAGCRRLLPHGDFSLSELAVRQATRRRGRSLAVITLIACGCFMIIAVGANRQAPASKGAGGFALYGETALPLLYDLNTADGRDAFAIADDAMQNVTVTPLRLRDGDDASCLNLNAALSPRLLGVDPKLLAGRFGSVDWALLDGGDGDVIPAIGDDATVTWSLYKKVGDTIDYIAENGRPIELRIAAVMPNSILQGSLIIGETNFQRVFPSISGHRVLLVDGAKANAATLTDALSDLGLELTPTAARLALFSSVQNTYLSIFAALGGLGLILGTAGLGAVVLRNMLERRSELAALTAVGFTQRRLLWLILIEHGLLLETGLLCGIICAVVAVWPAVRAGSGQVPYALLITLVVIIWASGLIWTTLATMMSLRGPLIAALRSE